MEEQKITAMTVDILGAHWTIAERAEADDARLSDCDGYCDWTARLIVIEREIDGNLDDMERYIRKVKRHEIIHAFLFECGLAESTMSTQAWSQNEEMVDWLARLGERIYKAWKDAGAVEADRSGTKKNRNFMQRETAIEKLPAADVRPVVRATWKRIDYQPCGHDYECSSCGWKNDMATHFCPNCGAKMDGGET